MSEDTKALIREIEEEVRREKLKKLWDTYGVAVLGVAAFALTIGLGWQWYVSYQRDIAQRAGSQFFQAIDFLADDKKKEGIEGLEQIARDGAGAYRVLAKLRLAADARQAGETDKAFKIYEEVAANSSTDALLQSFASLQAAALKVDGGDWTDLENRLKPLAEDSSPWRLTARELLGLAAYKNGKWPEARDAYTRLLASEGVPQNMRQRAQIAMTLITRGELAAEKGVAATGTDTDPKKDKSDTDGPAASAKPEAGEAAKTEVPHPAGANPGNGATDGTGSANDGKPDKK